MQNRQADHFETLSPAAPDAPDDPRWVVETGEDALISTRVSQFAYYDRVLGHPHWRGRKILDFGGNHGGFLYGAGDAVGHEDYWCMDIVRAALAHGQARFPAAHFVHYDRYHSEYNPGGTHHEPVPDVGIRFDYVLAFSVFTHIDHTELLDLVSQLRRLLAPDGILAFTFTDPSYDTGLSIFPSGRYMLKLLKALQRDYPALDIEGTYARACSCRWAVLLDDHLWIEPGRELCQQERRGRPLESYCAYYSARYMATLFPEAAILPPVGEEWQHCCVLGASGAPPAPGAPPAVTPTSSGRAR